MKRLCVEIAAKDHMKFGGIKMEKNEEKERVYLSQKKIKQLLEQPLLESSVGLSKDGKWVIHKTIITDIKSVKYYEKLGNPRD